MLVKPAATYRPPALPLATFLFFCSGALGLGYELVWIRKAALIVGASPIALSTVLSAFFVGLALGSSFFGRRVRTPFSPLVVYGVLELLIGLYALAFPSLFSLLKSAYAVAYPPLSGSAVALFGLRFGLLFLLFVVPTFFMGGTLPLLLDGLVSADRSIGPRTSFLYGINILGAVAGVLVTCYFAIPWLGMNGTSLAGGVGNLAIGAAALVGFRREARSQADHGVERLHRFFPAAAFASGLLAIGYQVCWARYFTLFTFSSVYTTAVLLAVYLLCLSAGSFLLAPMLRRLSSPLGILSVLQALVPLTTVLGLRAWRLAEYKFAIEREATGTGQMRPSITLEIAHDYPKFWHFFNEAADAVFFAPVFQVALVLAVPVVLIGVGLPALITAATDRSSSLRSVAGRLVFWNTLGSGAGSFITGYALLPLVGVHWTLLVLGMGSAGLAFAAAKKASETVRSRRGLLRMYALPAIGAAGVLGFFTLSEDITRETLRRELFGRATSGAKLIEVVEGPLTTAYISEDPASLRVGSGAVQMGHILKGSVNMQVLEGHLPSLFFPDGDGPRDCLGICLGSGQSFGALLRYPIRQLDVVEISMEITDLAREHLGQYNNDLARDRRVRFHLDDGRHFVERAPDASYDLVSMESSPPTADGMYSLYSVEFYEQVKRILRPGGVIMQFMPLYYLTPLDTKSVIKTFAEVFPDTFVAKVSLGDYMLLGYTSRPRFPVAAIHDRCRVLSEEWSERRLPQGRWTPQSRHPVASFEGVVSTLILGPEEVRRMEAPVIFHDDRQLLSYTSGDRWLARRYMGPALAYLSFAALRPTGFDRLKDYFDPPLSRELVLELTAERLTALKTFNVPDPDEIERRTGALDLARDPTERAGLALDLARDLDAALWKDEAYRYVEVALETLRDHPELTRPEHLETARRIVRNRIAVYAQTAQKWLDRWERRYAEAPLLVAMRNEHGEHRAREARAASRYLFP